MPLSQIVPAFDLFAPTHLIILAVILLLLFGRRVPEIMRGLGSSVKEFKKGMNPEDDKAAPSSQPQQSAPYQPPPYQPPPYQPPAAPSGTVGRDQLPPPPPAGGANH